jgi:hypothetical protein
MEWNGMEWNGMEWNGSSRDDVAREDDSLVRVLASELDAVDARPRVHRNVGGLGVASDRAERSRSEPRPPFAVVVGSSLVWCGECDERR